MRQWLLYAATVLVMGSLAMAQATPSDQNSGDAAQQQEQQAPAPDQGQAPLPDHGQTPPSEQGQHHGYGMHNGAPSPEQQLAHLSKRLKLTDDQKSKIMPILQDQAKQMQSLRQDTSLSPQDRHTKFQQIHQNTMSQIRPILDENQQKKFDKMTNEQEQRRMQRGSGPGGAGNGPQ